MAAGVGAAAGNKGLPAKGRLLGGPFVLPGCFPIKKGHAVQKENTVRPKRVGYWKASYIIVT